MAKKFKLGDSPEKPLTADVVVAYSSKIKRSKTKGDEARGEIGQHMKQFEDEFGGDRRALRESMRLIRLDNQDAIEYLKRVVFYYASQGGFDQGDLLNDIFSEAQISVSAPKNPDMSLDAAYQHGFKAGKNGKDRNDHQFISGTDLHDAFDRGWIAGQASIAGDKKPKQTKKKGGSDQHASA